MENKEKPLVMRKKASSARQKKGLGKRDQNKEQIKKRVSAAALALFQENGSEETTTRQISQRAEIAEGTIISKRRKTDALALSAKHDFFAMIPSCFRAA